MNTLLHPHITMDPIGGPMITETRFPVRSVVLHILQNHLTPYELMCRFPHLTLAQIHDALSFYYDNRKMVQQDMIQHPQAA